MILSYNNGFIMLRDTATYVTLAIFHFYYTSIQKGFKVLNGLDSLKNFAMLKVHCFMINSWYATLERREKKGMFSLIHMP